MSRCLRAASVSGVIDEYVRQLRHQLPGPGLARASMVREVRDGLDDAASAYVDDGLPRGAAERRAVEEFGPIGTLAAGLRDELTVAAGRSTATSAFVIGLVQLVGAQQLWKNEVTIAGWPSASETYLAWARAVDLFNLSAVALAGLALLVMTRGGRFVDPRPVVRALAIGVLTCIVIDIVAGVYQIGRAHV